MVPPPPPHRQRISFIISELSSFLDILLVIYTLIASYTSISEFKQLLYNIPAHCRHRIGRLSICKKFCFFNKANKHYIFQLVKGFLKSKQRILAKKCICSFYHFYLNHIFSLHAIHSDGFFSHPRLDLGQSFTKLKGVGREGVFVSLIMHWFENYFLSKITLPSGKQLKNKHAYEVPYPPISFKNSEFFFFFTRSFFYKSTNKEIFSSSMKFQKFLSPNKKKSGSRSGLTKLKQSNAKFQLYFGCEFQLRISAPQTIF